MIFTYWSPGQPSALSFIKDREDCVLLKYGDSGRWHDYPCDHVAFIPENYAWVCEFRECFIFCIARSLSYLLYR